MPQTTSASYNIGNSRQSARSNSFNRRNSGEFANQQRIIAERLRLVNEAKLLKQKQLANRPKLAILFNPTTYPPDALKLMEYLKDDTSASRFSIINYTDLATTLEEQYNLGFRFFASPTIGSFELYTYCIPFCKKYPDSLLFSTYSTQYFEDGVLPFNIILSSVNDNDLAHYIVNEILYKLHTLTKESAPVYYEPISYLSLDNIYPIFRKIVYIYTEKDANGNTDTYSEEYGNQLLNAVNLTNGDIEIQAFKISDNNFILPEEVKTLLSENPVSGHDFQYNSKTMFILNSYSPEKILQLFDEEYMYDNYFIFGYVFTSLHYTSKYKFNYAICPVGNYSFEGYKTAGFLPGGRQLSPFLYSISDVILKLLPYYTQIYYKYPNFSSTKFNEYFINRMKQINLFVDDNYWYERKIFTYYIGTKDGDLTNAQYNRDIFFKYKFNSGTNGTVPATIFEYSFVNTNLAPFNKLIHLPVINTSNSFSTLTTESTNNLNATTTVKITFVLANSSSLLGNDGINFNINQTVIDYYKNNTVTITKFSGIPLSIAGEQFANLPNLVISTTDTPTIFANTSLNKAFYNCTNFNSKLTSWNVSKVTNMDSMFENATNFNNVFSSLNWNCVNLTSAINFGLNSSLYGLGGDYNINPGNGVRSNKKTSIETPTITLAQPNSSLPDKTGTFKFSISDLQLFDTTKIPIINSISFISLGVSQNYGNSSNSITVTIVYKYKIILGNDGLSFKDVFSYYGNKQVTISQFGGIPLSRVGEQFANLPNLVISATDTPTILTNTSLNKAFYNCTIFNSDINNWNVSNVTNMSNMFENASRFNQNISSWNVSLVNNMSSMFQNAIVFNNNNTLMNWTCNSNLVADNFGDGSALYVNNGGTYIGNFGNASRNNKTSSIQTPIYSYDGTLIYNFINTGLTTDFEQLPIINFSNSFSVLNPNISVSGNTTTVTIIYNIPSNIKNNDGFSFKYIYSYYGSNKVTILQFGNIPLSKVGEQFVNLPNLVISATDTPSILTNTSLNKAFYNCTNFNSDINNWNVSNVINMSSMFKNASKFNQNINNWNVSNVTNMESMFENAIMFNKNISASILSINILININTRSWNVSNVTNMSSMFKNASNFNNNNTPMNWNCNSALVADNFGDGSALYTNTNTNNDYRKNAGNAKRIGNKSIQTPMYIYGTFIYTTTNPNVKTINVSSIYLPIININSSFIIGTITISNNKVITIPFSYLSINGDDGLSFKKIMDNYGDAFYKYGTYNITITQFERIPLSKSEEQFSGLENLVISAPDNPTILPNTSLRKAFYNCTNFNSVINNWNFSNVINMDSMFENATRFHNNFQPMYWNCSSLTSAINFGLNSSLYETGESFNINPRKAVRLSANNIDYYSIETETNNMSYKLTPEQVTDLTTVKSGTFKYKFVKTGLANFDNTKHLPIINNKSFESLEVTTNINKKTMYVEVRFSYRFILGDDGLSFRDVLDYYGSNTIEITDFGGIPLSSYDNYALPEVELNLACTSINYPTITKPSSVPPNTIVYFCEMNTSGTYNFNNIPGVYTKITAFQVGAGGSGGAGGGDSGLSNKFPTGNDGGHGTKLYGTKGSGGGGGEYKYITNHNLTSRNINIVVGQGGASVHGSDDSDDNGNNGNDGGNTSIKYSVNTSNILEALGGGNGNGGHPTSSAEDSTGGGTRNPDDTTQIEVGDGSSNQYGAYSGYTKTIKNNSSFFVSQLADDNGILFNNFGNGGNGTVGHKGYNANTDNTGPGKDGYARIYFIS
jgi:surface protein